MGRAAASFFASVTSAWTSWIPFGGAFGFEREHYDVVAVVNLHKEGGEFLREPDVEWPPKEPVWIAVMKRRELAAAPAGESR